MLADLAVLSADFFTVDEEAIKAIESVLTLAGGKVVYADGEFKPLGPAPIPVLPDWSPATNQPGRYRPAAGRRLLGSRASADELLYFLA